LFYFLDNYQRVISCMHSAVIYQGWNRPCESCDFTRWNCLIYKVINKIGDNWNFHAVSIDTSSALVLFHSPYQLKAVRAGDPRLSRGNGNLVTGTVDYAVLCCELR